ncbi:hypothetical protein F5X96DRAFT_667723 [Biscogniauxia mediterranea]|nr:hypothetical protein F5X96DRAFT_667723 [Biscogniauxia mediterranea]
MALRSIDPAENRRRMENGELYFAFTPDLIADRRRCRQAFDKFNDARDITRRQQVELFQRIINDTTALPPLGPTPEEDEDQLADWVWCDAPIKMDYGYNVK